jgi:death-on-curing protein
MAVELSLACNGHALVAEDADCVLTLLAVAAGTLDEASFADWIRRHARPCAA